MSSEATLNVKVNGKSRLSCLQFAAQLDGCAIKTIEGVDDGTV